METEKGPLKQQPDDDLLPRLPTQQHYASQLRVGRYYTQTLARVYENFSLLTAAPHKQKGVRLKPHPSCLV